MKTGIKVSRIFKDFMMASAVYLVCAPSFAGSDVHTPMRQPMSAMPMYFKELDLTTEQQDKVKAIWAAQSDEMKVVWKQLRTNREAEQSLIEAPKFDTAKAQKMADADAKLIAQNNVTLLKSRHDIYQVLTPDQRTKLEAIRLQKQHAIESRIDNNSK